MAAYADSTLACRCMHEMAAVSSLPEHPNIVAYYRAWQQAAHFYIQMALCEGGSLADLLEKVLPMLNLFSPDLSFVTQSNALRPVLFESIKQPSIQESQA